MRCCGNEPRLPRVAHLLGIGIHVIRRLEPEAQDTPGLTSARLASFLVVGMSGLVK
jgi:hypothetical protein